MKKSILLLSLILTSAPAFASDAEVSAQATAAIARASTFISCSDSYQPILDANRAFGSLELIKKAIDTKVIEDQASTSTSVADFAKDQAAQAKLSQQMNQLEPTLNANNENFKFHCVR